MLLKSDRQILFLAIAWRYLLINAVPNVLVSKSRDESEKSCASLLIYTYPFFALTPRNSYLLYNM